MSDIEDQTGSEEARGDNWYCRTVFFVKDLATSVGFYQQQLGFKEEWRHEQAAAQVVRNGLEIVLCQHPARSGKGRVFISLDAGQTRELEKEFTASGVEVSFVQWGMTVMAVADEDGNELYITDDAIAH